MAFQKVCLYLSAALPDEEGAYPESDDSFGQVSIGAFKVATMIKVSDELLNDNVFRRMAFQKVCLYLSAALPFFSSPSGLLLGLLVIGQAHWHPERHWRRFRWRDHRHGEYHF